MPGWAESRCIVGMLLPGESTSREPLAFGRCSPMCSRWCRFRLCSRWRSAYIALADPAGGRAVLRQAHDILQQRPDLGSLPKQADELRLTLDTIRGGALGASSLTTAELRLLTLLPTHLSFREIGERLYVSRHTVKTQAISIYRKLGVSSRSEAIARVHELGLLTGA